jgi:hypothetical protein
MGPKYLSMIGCFESGCVAPGHNRNHLLSNFAGLSTIEARICFAFADVGRKIKPAAMRVVGDVGSPGFGFSIHV